MRISIVVALCAIAAARAGAQAISQALPPEPPSSLFSAKLGDSEVEALAQGFWEASVLTSGTMSLGPDGFGFNPVPFLFTQTPDLYLFLRFRQTWLFEAYVTKDAADSRFMLAFEGGDGDFVRSARLGNSDITMPDYPYMSFGAPKGSFGSALSAYDPVRDVSVDAMVRWEGLSWRTRAFFGTAEAQETALSPADDLRGRRFALPGAPLSSLRLVETTAAGGPRTLRTDEYSVSLATGAVLLAAEPAGALTAEYVSGGVTRVETLYEFTVDEDGDAARRDNRYEARNLYGLTDTDASRQLFVRNLATGATDSRFAVSRVSAGLVQVVRGDASPDPDDEAYMRPFGEAAPWVYDEPDDVGTSYSTGEGFAIIARVVESVDTIVLDQETVAGTVTVYRDGVESASFTYDGQSRTLELLPAPRSGERVEVRYAVSSADRSDGALAFGLGSRFPWLGLDWSAAAGGRWPLFGLGYDEGGELKSAWTGVSAGVAKKADAFSFELEAMGRYLRAGASGLYRVAGMEEYGSSTWLVPFRAVQGDAAGVVPSSAADSDLGAGGFAEIMAELHPDGLPNRALTLVAGTSATGAETRFIRYVDYVPLSSYERLSFFVKADDAPIGSTLRVSVGDGEGAGASVTVPLDGLGTGWRKVELDLGPGAAARVSGGDGADAGVTGVLGAYGEPAAAGLVELVVTGLSSGSVMVDEMILEGARDGFSGLARGSFRAGGADRKSGPYLRGAASGVVDADPAAAASLEAGWVAPFLDVKASAAPAFVSGTGSYGLGYVVAVPGPGAPVRVVDQFSRDVVQGTFGKSLEGALTLSGLSMKAKAESAEESASFAQAWSAMAGLCGVASIAAAASLDASSAVIGESGLADSWLRSWLLLAPAAESTASSRRMSLSAEALGSVLTANLKRDFAAAAPADNEASARASVPFRIGALSLTPYYERKTTLERATVAVSFSGDVSDYLVAAGGAAGLWSVLPLAELWTEGAFNGFASFADGAAKAAHKAEVGLEARRPIGYGLLDLFAPSAATAGFAREVAMTDDTVVESSVLSLSLSGGAANVFASSGSAPLLPSVSFDEYSGKTALTLTYYPSDGAILPNLSSSLAASFEGAAGAAFSLTSNLSYARTRSAAPWSETLGLALTTRPARTWLGDLAALAIRARGDAPAIAAASQEPASERTWISDWLDSILADPPALKDTFGLEGSAGRASSASAPLALRASFDYSTKVVAGGSLTLGVGAKLWQVASCYDDGVVWSAGYTFSLDAKVVF